MAAQDFLAGMTDRFAVSSVRAAVHPQTLGRADGLASGIIGGLLSLDFVLGGSVAHAAGPHPISPAARAAFSGRSSRGRRGREDEALPGRRRRWTLAFDIHKDKDRFRLVGTVSTAGAACSRCLEPFRLPVDAAFDLRYLPCAEATRRRRTRDRGRRPRRRSTATTRSTWRVDAGAVLPGAADEAAVPPGLPRAVPAVRDEPEHRDVRVRAGGRIPGWRPESAEHRDEQHERCLIQNDAIPRPGPQAPHPRRADGRRRRPVPAVRRAEGPAPRVPPLRLLPAAPGAARRRRVARSVNANYEPVRLRTVRSRDSVFGVRHDAHRGRRHGRRSRARGVVDGAWRPRGTWASRLRSVGADGAIGATLVAARRLAAAAGIEIVDAPDVVAMDDPPRRASAQAARVDSGRGRLVCRGRCWRRW